MSAILTPLMQNDLVTKKEFGEFKTEMSTFRSEVNTRFDDVTRDIGGIKADVGSLRGEFTEFKAEINDDINRNIGMIYEKSQHDLKMATEYLESVIEKHYE